MCFVDELDQAMQALGKAWSDLLSHTDEELGIDPEFTRPGTEALLDDFKDSINNHIIDQECAPFKWDAYKTASKPSAAAGNAPAAKTKKATGKRKADEA